MTPDKSADLWAQKAYVSFWRSMHSSGSQKLVATNAKEIMVYLREAFQIDSGSPVLQDLADRIAHGLWVIASIRYRTIAENASDSEGNFPLQALEDAAQCLDLMDTAWDVAWNKDPNWLHFILLQFNNYGKIAWGRLQNNQLFDNTHVLTGISWRQGQLVQKIRMVSPNYVPPPPQHPPFNWVGAISVVLVIIILIAYAASK
jgi:hypothetical protein